MAAYLIGSVSITDESWVSGYAINVHDIVHKHGGNTYHVVANVIQTEGEPNNVSLIAVVEFPTTWMMPRHLSTILIMRSLENLA